MVYEICNEDTLFEAINRFETGNWDDRKKPKFVNWPERVITICGRDFDGGIPTRILPALSNFQLEINHGYTRCVYGSSRPHRSLPHEVKANIELVIYLSAGSSDFRFSRLADVLNNVSLAAIKKLSGGQIVIIVLGVAALWTARVMWHDAIVHGYQSRWFLQDPSIIQQSGGFDGYLPEFQQQWDHYIHEMAENIRKKTKATDRDIKHLESIKSLVKKYPLIADQYNYAKDMRYKFLKRLYDHDQLVIDGRPVIDGKTFRDLTRKPRGRRVTEFLDGNFFILFIGISEIDEQITIVVGRAGASDDLLPMVFSAGIWKGTQPWEKKNKLYKFMEEKKSLNMKFKIVHIKGRLIEMPVLLSAS